MATLVHITVDTELSPGLHQEGASAAENYARMVEGRTEEGVFGMPYLMDRLEAHGLTGIFFVAPCPALVYGPDMIARIVEPIRARGHDVQLHLHTEWLDFMERRPVGDRRGRNIADFSLADQQTLINLGRDLLMAAGAKRPCAFRAGNFGANDDTLRALATLGFDYDSSFNPAYIGDGCDISLPPDLHEAIQHEGVTELPVSCILQAADNLRHAQLCALSSWEMRDALSHAADAGAGHFTIVLHSFELLVRDTNMPNPIMLDRFEAMCEAVAADPRLECATFAGPEEPEVVEMPPEGQPPERLPPNLLRTAMRIGEQAYAKLRYERG